MQKIDPEYLQYKSCYERRIKMRNDNFAAISTYNQKQQLLMKRNSKIAAIQKFISKLKTENRNAQALLIEMDTLNLSKYLQEVANNITTSVTQKQVEVLAEMASKLTQFYENFSPILIKQLKKQFESVLASNDENKIQLKAILHLTTELFLCAFPLPYKDISQFIKKIFKAGTPINKEGLTELQKKQRIYSFNSDIYAMFVTNYGEVFCNRSNRNIKKWIKQGYQLKKFPQIIPGRTKQQITKFFEKYIKEVFAVLETSYKNIKELQKNLTQQLKLNGNFLPESEKKYRITCQRYNFTKSKLIQISEAINQEINIEILNRPVIQIEEINKNYLNQIENGQIFQDQYQFQLYKKLISIQETDTKVIQDQKKYEEFREKLDTCKNMSDADAFVLQFLKINTKKTRKLLIKDLLQYRKQYQLVTPFLCRIAATLYQKYKDIADYINQLLFIDYEKLKDTTLNTFVIVDKKNRNLKYICQLTKFQLIDSDKMLHCLKLLIQDLNGSNIQLLIACLESVGRFLYISKNSASKFIFLLTQLNNVLKKKSLPIMTESQITNCINLLKPSKPITKKQKRLKSEIQQKISQILKVLDENNIQQIVIKLQLLEKEDPSCINFIVKKIAKKIPKHKFTSCYLFAIIIKRLNNQKIIKEMLNLTKLKIHESIKYELAQESIQWARFYGQLFNYEIIEKEELYAMLQDLLKIEQNYIGAINCICSTLQVSKMYLKGFKRAASINKKLRFFFKFKRYINTRKYIPMFVEFEVLDILDQLQPQVLKLTNEQIDNFLNQMDKMQQGRKKQLNQCQQLLKYVNNDSEFIDKLDYKENSEQKIQRPEEEINPNKNYGFQFERELNDRIEKQFKNSNDRITKPKILESFVKKKGGKLSVKSEATINIIGRVGDKLVKRELKKQ